MSTCVSPGRQSIRFEETILVTPKCCDFFAGGITHGGLGGDGRGGDGLPRRLRGEGHVRELRGRQLAARASAWLPCEISRCSAGSFPAGWLAGEPGYPQKLKVPEGYEKRNENRNI